MSSWFAQTPYPRSIEILFATLSFCSADLQEPSVVCPGLTLFRDNDKGSNISTVYWDFNYTDNSLTESEPGISLVDIKVVLTINNKTFNSSLPKLLPIGDNKIQYNVTDARGNFNDKCTFIVQVAGE